MKSRLRLGVMSLFSLLWIAPQLAGAWGAIGHQAIGYIGEKALTPTNRLIALDLLNGDNFANAATWADRIKNIPSWSHTRPYHYADMPDNTDYLDNLRNLTPQELGYGDAIRVLVKAEDILRDSAASRKEKSLALRFMIHFVGDIHQPLHAGRVEDKGGNSILVDWFGVKSNLHAVWDTLMIKTLVERKASGAKKPVVLEDYIATLRVPSPKEINKWQSSYLTTWFSESLSNRDGAYADDANQSEGYFKRNVASTSQRVLQASYRLAGWLNAILSNPDVMTAEGRKIRNALASVLGPHHSDQIKLTEQSAAINFNSLSAYQDPCAKHQH